MSTRFSALLAGLAMAAVCCATAGSATAFERSARPSVAPAMQLAAVTPLSMQYFCARHKNECAGGGRGEVAMTTSLMAVLGQVNGHVNRAIRPRRDTSDTWSLNPSSGDCEDYVLSKRSALVRKGVPAGALRIAYTHTRRGEPHAVLVVRTSQGDFVLDNLNNTVKTLRQSGYKVRSMSSADPTRWGAS
jgi:predicted transglutaminase-like cysteine proteinase